MSVTLSELSFSPYSLMAVAYIPNHAVRHRIKPVDLVSSTILHSDLVHSQKVERLEKEEQIFKLQLLLGQLMVLYKMQL